MISAWRKFINKNGLESDASLGRAGHNMPPGVQKLDRELQRKFAKGVNYNMKVVIKGDNKVGKTSLFLRLKGYGFEEDYTPTESLNVTSIDWSYKATDDIVKIDLWEAIDSATKKSVNFVDLKLEDNGSVPTKSDDSCGVAGAHDRAKSKVIITSTQFYSNNNNSNHTNPIPESALKSLAELSATYDVYNGAHAVLLMMDMTKSWTFKYVQSELPKIPKHIPVLVIANHRDQGHHRTISPVQMKSFIDSLERNSKDGTIMYTETSMKNGFGMRLVEKFFNIPFLKLQEAALIKQLELNRLESSTTFEELQMLQECIDREYEQYLELETIRRRQQADAMSPVSCGVRKLDESTREQIRNANLSSDIIDKRSANVTSIESENPKKNSIQPPSNFVSDRMASIVIGAKCPLLEMKSSISAAQDQTDSNGRTEQPDTSDDSEEEEQPRANPLVANYQSDVDSDDQAK